MYGHILRTDTPNLTETLRIIDKTDEDLLDGLEYVVKAVSETELATIGCEGSI
jgi:hypothetical protein